MPRKGDLMLLSARELKCRDQIIKDGSFCAILVVISAKTDDKSAKDDDNYEVDYVASMDILLSQWPYGCLNQETSYQVLHLTNMTTCECSWEVMVRGSKESSQIINLILTKNTDGEYGQFTDKENIFKAAYDDFGLNKS
jgi:hypothetical protein